jgi:POT family proton-dependent oligopeptide transporter
MNTESNTIQEYPKGQPKAFYLLFFVEMWERFGFYVMRALLVLYMSNVFKFSDDKAYAVFGSFAALLYITPMIGGWIGDRVIGYRRALVVGAALLSVGYFLLMISGETFFYIGLSFVIVGNGFFKPSPASLLGKVYGRRDPRLQSGYTLFYMAINVGSFCGILVSGFVAHHFGWSYAFGISGIGLQVSLTTFISRIRLIKDAGSRAGLEALEWRKVPVLVVGAIVAIGLSIFLFQHSTIAQWVLYAGCIAAIVYFCFIAMRLHDKERSRFLVCIFLIIIATAFFALYFQAPMSINLFTERNIDRHVFGMLIPASTYQTLNPFFVITLAPLLAGAYKFMNKRKSSVSIPMKFAIGTFLMGIGFLVLSWAKGTANAQGLMSTWWIVLSYFLQSVAELLVSALGVAMVAKLVPHKYLGLMMGGWYLSSVGAAMLGSYLAKWASVSSKLQGDPLVSLHIYTQTFDKFGWGAIIISAAVFCFVPVLQRMSK